MILLVGGYLREEIVSCNPVVYEPVIVFNSCGA